MKRKMQQLIAGSGGKYIAIGLGVYVLELLVIMMAQRAGLSAVAAVAIGFWVGLVLSFLLQKLITFGDKRMHHKVVATQIVAYVLLVLFNFGFTLLFTSMFAAAMPAALCRTIALGITTMWNYFLYRTKIFAQNP